MDATVQVSKRERKANPAYRKTVMVEIALAYPQVRVAQRQAASRRINAYYAETAQRQYEEAMRRLFPDAVKDARTAAQSGYPFHPYSSAMAYEVPYNSGGLLSIYYDQYTYTGGAHGNTVRSADTWRVWDGRRVPTEAFFHGEGWKQAAQNAILAQIARRPQIYFENPQQNVPAYFDTRNMYLTPQGFVFYFPLYTIAPYATGMPSFLVPYETFGNLLRIRPV